MPLKQITPPATEPVSLVEAKAYLSVNDADDDAFISDLIPAVRRVGELYTRRVWISQTWALWLDRVPTRQKSGSPLEGHFELPVNHFDEPVNAIEIPLPPLLSIDHVKTFDQGNVESIFDPSNFLLDNVSEPGRIALNNGKSWPTGLRRFNAVEIQFVAGYGAAASVPKPLKVGVLQWIKLLMTNRSKLLESEEQTGAHLELNAEQVPPHIESLWSPFRIVRL